MKTTPTHTAKLVLKNALGAGHDNMVNAFVDVQFPKAWRERCTEAQLVGWIREAQDYLLAEIAEQIVARSRMN